MNRFLSSLNPKYMYTSRSYFTLKLITNLIACLCIIMLSSCNKDPYQDGTPELPPISMEGKNTLGFLLDGKVWVPYQDNPGLFTPTLEPYLDLSTFTITARQKREKLNVNQSFGTGFIFNGVGIYQIPPPPHIGYVFTDENKVGVGCNYFKCLPANTEIKIIYYDSNLRIISGTFNFKDAANSCGDTIQITEGRFDLKY